ncbi:MAG: tetratricopeptide repeat protein [Chloroflexi bacterium]|nr:tetratricopeptide repeat protein [Chloroflexota bacterium]
MAGLKIHLLGGLQISRADAPITDFISNKVPALLAYLAVTHRAHSRDKLASLLWGEMSEADAKNNLRQALANLRRVADDHLTVTRDSVEFSGDGFLDSAQFESDVKSASSLGPEPASVILIESLRLYRGDFLEGFHVRDAPDFEDWMLTERARLRELALEALHTLTHFHTSLGNFAEAMATASRLLTFDPWREEAHRQLMLLQARTGQFSAALAQYETCKKILEKELGVQPSLETTALYERIRAARQSARHNLPALTTEFIGREKELGNLRQRLADPQCRLVTVTGLGGCGKTRLAQETARACADMFINGAWFAPLAAVEAEGIVPAVGNVFNFPFSTGDHKKQLLNFLRQKELLLVLDNFEHLLESSALLSDILKTAPEVKLLVTSRERLDIDGEWVVELSGLDVGSSSAAQLFAQSAKRAGAEIRFSEQDQAAIAEICQMVGGLPLGIEIAAGRIRSMDYASIADEIRKGLDFLASTRRDVPERQRSLRAVFESSWEKLSEAEQKAFAALSVFRGGFTREAAEQVAGAVIASLVDKSLVQRNDARFELHEVMRQFAEEKLSARKKLAQQARAAHASYFAEWAKKYGTADERDSFPAMHRELENVRAAWNWASEQADVAALASLAPFTKRYLDLQGRYREGIEIFQRALAGLGAPANVDDLPLDERGHLIARLLMYKAILIADAGEPDASFQSLKSCLDYFRRTEEDAQLATCLNGLGNACRFLGQEAEAVDYYREELELARSMGNRNEEGMALNNLALSINTLGRFEEAERLHRECLALRRELNDYSGLSSSLINLSVVLFDQHRSDEAKPLLYEAIEISRQLNQTRQQAAALGNLGGILLEEGRHEEALRLFLQGLEIHRNTGYRFGMAIALDNVGTAHYRLGNEQDALYYLKQSLREARDIRSDLVALDALVSIAGLRARNRDKESALELFGLIRHHPKADPETVHNVEKLLPQVVEGMSADAARAAEERGKTRELADVVAAILSAY